MGPFDPFDYDDVPESSVPEFPMSRRTFLGSVGATTLATAVLGEDAAAFDETALQFAWGNDPDAGGARVLDVSIITRDKPKAGTSEVDPAPEESTEAPLSEFGAITESAANPANTWFWRIRPESFGPQAYFALKTSRRNGFLTYELRVADVSYGRMRPVDTRRRAITFVFRQLLWPRSESDPKKQIKRFVLSARTTIWSSDNGPNLTSSFTMSGPVENNSRRQLLFRDFIESEGTENALYIDVPLRRVTNTAALMFNALITRLPGGGNPAVDLWYLNTGRWRVESESGAMAAFNGRVALSSLDVFWPVVQSGQPGVAAEAPLFGIGTPAPANGESTQSFEIGRGRDAPAFRGSWATERTKVYFRAQRPQDGTSKKTRTIRAEAMLQTDWTGVSFVGKDGRHTVANMPRMFGAVLERVDYSDSPDGSFPATTAGSLSFQARYGVRAKADGSRTIAGFTAMETPLGKITAQGIRDGEEDGADGDFSFPKRRGWPVTALFNWPNSEKADRRGTRGDPITQLIDAEVAVLEAGIALPGAEYSRLSFAPTALRTYYSQFALERPPLGSFLNLAPKAGTEFARVDLSRAKLRASRSESLLSLKFAFSDLALSFRDESVEFVSYNTACDLTTRPGDFDALQPHDTRPTLVVEFPPQHLFEEAKFFQTTPPLPDVQVKRKLVVTKKTGETVVTGYDNETPPTYTDTDGKITLDSDNRVHLSDAIAAVKSIGGVSAVKAFRTFVKELKQGDIANNNRPDLEKRFQSVAERLAAAKRPNGAPADQFIYVGPVAMDIDVRQVAHAANEKLWQKEAGKAVNRLISGAAAHAAKLGGATAFDQALTIASRVEGMMPTYQRFRDFWREQMVSLLFAPSTAHEVVRKLHQRHLPTSSATAQIEHIPIDIAPFASEGAPPKATFDARLDAVKTAFAKQLFQREDLAAPSRARLSNPSRLAFRVNCRDGLDAVRTKARYDLDAPEDAEQRLPRENLPFHLDTLTHFRGMELAVTARAEIVYEPGELGLIAPRRARIADSSGDAMLERLGFSMGNEVSARTRLADIASSLKPPTPLETAIEIPSRLTLSPHQNAVVLTPPADLFAGQEGDPFDYEPTATEPPKRIPAPNFRPTKTLWQARFVTEAHGLGLNPGLRAVHSPDLRPGALLTRFGETNVSMPHVEPPGGPFDPWFLSRMQGHTPVMTEDELNSLTHLIQPHPNPDSPPVSACELPHHKVPGIVARLCAYFRTRANKSAYDMTRLRGPMDTRDRHQLVLLSSAWGLPAVGRRTLAGELTAGSSQFEPSNRAAVWDVMPGSAIYQPKTLDVTELALSSIGGTLRHDTGFQPPAGALFWQDNKPIFDALSIERWQQWTNLGRDIFTEVVYKGFLFPFGLRASLVKVTERIFHFEVATGNISAPLRQRMFIRVADPEKLFPAVKQPFGGRRFPVRRLNLLTTTTPDIVDPNDDAAPGPNGVGDRGRIGLRAGSRGIAFWPRIFGAQDGNIRFEMDIDGVKTDLPLIFVDNTAANHQETVKALVDYYSNSAHVPHPDTRLEPVVETPTGSNGPLPPVEPLRHLRTLAFRGAERRYAEEVDAGGATFQTDHWTLSASGLHEKITEIPNVAPEQYTFQSASHVFGPTLQGADQPPFYPVMEVARIHLTQTERLIGRPLMPVRAQFDARYVANGFVAEGAAAKAATLLNPVPEENASEVVLTLRDQPVLDMGRKGDQSGGVYRPSGHVTALSRSKGALTRADLVTPPAISTPTLYSLAGRFSLPAALQTPVLGGTGTSPQKHTPAPASPSQTVLDKKLKEIRDIYKECLGSDSKILGLVSLRELIDLIQRLSDPDEGLPDLAEKTEFGAGLLQDVEDATNVIRERIVAPLAAAVRRIRDGWDAIEEDLNEGQQDLGVPVKPVTISEIFPELDNSLVRLDEALANAEGETDEVLFALELGACYSAGQQFLGALERAAANPGQRVEEALSKRYTEVLGLFEALEKGIGPWIRNLLVAAILENFGLGTSKAEIESFDPKEFAKRIADRLSAAASDAIKAAIDKAAEKVADRTILLAEVIRLPRTDDIYENADGSQNPDKKTDFEKCIATLTPDTEDVRVIFAALFKSLVTQELITDAIDGIAPDPEALIKRFLDDQNTKIDFDEEKFKTFFDASNGNFAAHVDTQLVAIGTKIVDAFEAKGLTAPEKEITDIINDLKADILDETNGVFNGAASDLSEALRAGDVKTQIRNRYIACVVLNLINDKANCIPELIDLDPEWLTELLRWLRRQVRNPFEGIPDLSGIFRPLIALLRKIMDILAALFRRDFSGLFRLLRELFDDIKLPEFDVSINLCTALGPVWKGTSFTMKTIADLGETITAPVFHPPDWTGPPCPLTTSQADLIDENGKLPPFSASQENSLSATIFAVRAYSDMLFALVTKERDDLIGQRKHLAKVFQQDPLQKLQSDIKATLEAVKKALSELQTDINNNGGAYQNLTEFRNEVDKKLKNFEDGLAQTADCLGQLSDTAGKTHCSLADTTEAIKSLSADLHLAAKLPICNADATIDRKVLNSLIAMTHLPRDVRVVDERIRALNTNMRDFVGALSVKMQDISERAKDKESFELLAFVLTSDIIVDLLNPANTMTGNEGKTLVADAAAQLKPLKDHINAMSTYVRPLVAAIIETLCRGINQMDVLREKAKTLLDETESWINQTEAALADPQVPEVFKPQIQKLLADVKSQIDLPLHRANLVKIDQTFETLRTIEAALCEDGKAKKVPDEHKNKPLAVLTSLKLPGEDGTALDTITKAFEEGSGSVDTLQGIADSFGDGVQTLSTELRQFFETGPRKAAQAALTPYIKGLLNQSIQIDNPSLSEDDGQLSLATLYKAVETLRNDAHGQLDVLPGGDTLQEAFLVAPDAARSETSDYKPKKFSFESGSDEDRIKNDQLAGDVVWLNIVKANTGEISNKEARFITEFVREWAEAESTPRVILGQIVDLVEDILSGHVFKNIDFAAIREEVEDYLLSLVPSKIRMGYGFEIELGSEVAKATAGIFAPKPGTRLGIDMKIVIDLLQVVEGDVSIDFRSVGRLGPFDIKLVGDMFDALTLRFASAEFVTEGGSKSDIKIAYTDHKIGPQLKFVEKLQKYLAPKDGSGAIIRFFPQQPGLEAGYRLHLGDFSVGNLAFTNVGLETTAILPFSDSEALFKASLSSRPNPFTLTYAPYGGSGFFAIYATVDGIVGFEASFEFGGSGVFAAGPLSGQGRIMSGVYIRQLKMDGVKITEIAMTFFAGGSASIWIFNFAAALSVKLGMVNGNMSGEATFSFSFSMGLADFEYSVTMVKQEGEGFQGQSASLGTVRVAELGDFARPHQKENRHGSLIETAGQCQSQNWRAFKSYFDDKIDFGEYF